jgi:hypothetical protein
VSDFVRFNFYKRDNYEDLSLLLVLGHIRRCRKKSAHTERGDIVIDLEKLSAYVYKSRNGRGESSSYRVGHNNCIYNTQHRAHMQTIEPPRRCKAPGSR